MIQCNLRDQMNFLDFCLGGVCDVKATLDVELKATLSYCTTQMLDVWLI